MVKNHTIAMFEWCALCLVIPWFIFTIYFVSTDVYAHAAV